GPRERQRFERFVGALGGAPRRGVGRGDAVVVGGVRIQPGHRRLDFDRAFALPHREGRGRAGGGFPVGGRFAVFEFAFGEFRAVGVDRGVHRRQGLIHGRGGFGNDRRGRWVLEHEHEGRTDFRVVAGGAQ